MKKLPLMTFVLLMAAHTSTPFAQDQVNSMALERVQYSDYKGLPKENAEEVQKYQDMMNEVIEEVVKWREAHPREDMTDDDVAELTDDYSEEKYGMSSDEIVESYQAALDVTEQDQY